MKKKKKIKRDRNRKKGEMKSKLEAIWYRILTHLEDYSIQSFGEFSQTILYSFLMLQYQKVRCSSIIEPDDSEDQFAFIDY